MSSIPEGSSFASPGPRSHYALSRNSFYPSPHLRLNKMPDSWSSISIKVQQSILDSIPSGWKLPSHIAVQSGQNVSSLIPDQGLLSARQLYITSNDASRLAQGIRDREFTAYEVTEAFCARAALAHQLVSICFITVTLKSNSIPC